MSDTREYIIDQAYGLFLSRSYEAVSISEISKAIGFTKGALYHHFTNKEDLFKAVIDKYLPINDFFIPFKGNTLKEYIDECVKIAEEVIEKIVGRHNNFIPINYLSLLIDAFRHYPRYANEKEQLILNEFEHIEEIIKKAIENNEIRKDINPTNMALNFYSLNMGIAGNLIINNSPKKAIEALRDQLYELYNLMKL
ncbi:MAG: TetR/AcrR family transcriptional regulator [Bacteroidales bacterium]